jgi:ubiquinone/menaquinone biosynthesis C-methylase UbiE
LLDLGAGNGLIGQVIHDQTGMAVKLADIVDYCVAKLPLILFNQGERLPLDEKCVDTTLLYLVLHHAEDPDQLLSEAVRVTRQRIVIMEGYVEDNQTYMSNALLDWFLNRIVQGADINMPLHYRTIDRWRMTFRSLGLKVVAAHHVGIDEPLAPEEHVLFVLDVPT